MSLRSHSWPETDWGVGPRVCALTPDQAGSAGCQLSLRREGGREGRIGSRWAQAADPLRPLPTETLVADFSPRNRPRCGPGPVRSFRKAPQLSPLCHRQ